jgi:hypothetical protein
MLVNDPGINTWNTKHLEGAFDFYTDMASMARVNDSADGLYESAIRCRREVWVILQKRYNEPLCVRCKRPIGGILPSLCVSCRCDLHRAGDIDTL